MNELGYTDLQDTEELPLHPNLTPRESEILTWLAHGKTDREIANLVGLSEKTIHHHVERIKLQARNRTHAVARALQLKLIRLE
jgi:LuxR family quorum-sensing transcriptional regulator LasR